MDRYEILAELAGNHPAGAKLVELSEEELLRVFGGGDVQAETSPACIIGGITIGWTLSKMYC
jgi:type 2 lantibiotic (TIGR03893 family)